VIFQRPDHRLKGTERKQPVTQARRTHGPSTSDLDDPLVELMVVLAAAPDKGQQGNLVHRERGHHVRRKGATQARDIERHCLKVHHFNADMVGDTDRRRIARSNDVLLA
jgi:hypothetical protein